MNIDYISTDTRQFAFSVFCKMSEKDLVKELTALKSTIDGYGVNGEVLIDSFVFEYLNNVFDIAKDALVYRFVRDVSVSDVNVG